MSDKTFKEITPEERSEILEAFINGKPIQYRVPGGGWSDKIHKSAESYLIINDCLVYRIKPLLTFGELTKKEKMELFEAWVDGKTIEYWSSSKNRWVETRFPIWERNAVYRVKEN